MPFWQHFSGCFAYSFTSFDLTAFKHFKCSVISLCDPIHRAFGGKTGDSAF